MSSTQPVGHDAIHGINDPMAKLAMMANQIAQFFRPYPREQALTGISHHIEAFWTPKMRKTFLEHLAGYEGVDPLVREALESETNGKNPVEKAAADPNQVGELGAVDAG